MTALDRVRHARAIADAPDALCGARTGRNTRPTESVSCPQCRVILNHVRRTYPEHADYTDWRPTKAQRHEAASAMYRDLVLGEVND